MQRRQTLGALPPLKPYLEEQITEQRDIGTTESLQKADQLSEVYQDQFQTEAPPPPPTPPPDEEVPPADEEVPPPEASVESSIDDLILQRDIADDFDEEIYSILEQSSFNLYHYGAEVAQRTVDAFLEGDAELRMFKIHPSKNVMSYVGDENEFFVSLRGDETDKDALLTQAQEALDSIRLSHPDAHISLVSSDQQMVIELVKLGQINAGFIFNAGSNSSSWFMNDDGSHLSKIYLTEKPKDETPSTEEVPPPEEEVTQDIQSESVMWRDMRRYSVSANAAYDNYLYSPELAQSRAQEYLPKHKVLPGYSSKNYVTFIRERSNSPSEIIVSLRGTSVFNTEDLALDARIAAGKSLENTDRYLEALDVVGSLRSQYPEASLSVVGHSLGGTIAEELTRKEQVRSYVFNEGSSPMSWLTEEDDTSIDKTTHSNMTTYYRSSYDSISLASSISNPDTVTVESPSIFAPHTVENFTPPTRGVLPIDQDPPIRVERPKIFVYNEDSKQNKEHNECYIDPVTGRRHCPPKHRSLYHQLKYA
eukprot:4140244-Pleurochrysis_carterae.AAC.8